MRAELNDLYKELWLRRRNSGELVWKSKSGDIPIKDMTDEHLNNAIIKTEQYEYMLDSWIEYEANHSGWGCR